MYHHCRPNVNATKCRYCSGWLMGMPNLDTTSPAFQAFEMAYREVTGGYTWANPHYPADMDPVWAAWNSVLILGKGIRTLLDKGIVVDIHNISPLFNLMIVWQRHRDECAGLFGPALRCDETGSSSGLIMVSTLHHNCLPCR